jgi:hypothetical protein
MSGKCSPGENKGKADKKAEDKTGKKVGNDTEKSDGQP